MSSEDSKSTNNSQQPEPVEDAIKRLEKINIDEQQKLNDLLSDLASAKDRVLTQQQVASRSQSNLLNLQNKYLISIIQEQNKRLQNTSSSLPPQHSEPPASVDKLETIPE